MIDDMPRPRPPHLHRERGKWVFRIGHGPRVKLTAPYGSPEFVAQYRAAMNGETTQPRGKASKGTLQWLWERYRETTAWQRLSIATRRQRENIMRGVLESAGREPYADITRKIIVEGRDRRAATPAMARHFVDTMRGLFRWALDAEHVDADPTRDVDAPKPRTEGHHPWTIDELRTYMTRWPLGTRERLAFDVLLFTGLRRGDAVVVGRQHVRSGIITLKTEKTGETVQIAILPILQASIDAGPCGDMAFIAGENGNPLTKESFGNWFGAVCRSTGVPGTAHGLRKALATLASEGLTEKELDSIFGWRGGGMAGLYTRTANRTRLAASGMAKVEQIVDALFPQKREASHTPEIEKVNQHVKYQK